MDGLYNCSGLEERTLKKQQVVPLVRGLFHWFEGGPGHEDYHEPPSNGTAFDDVSSFATWAVLNLWGVHVVGMVEFACVLSKDQNRTFWKTMNPETGLG